MDGERAPPSSHGQPPLLERAGSRLERILDQHQVLPVSLFLAAALRLSCLLVFDVRPVSDYTWYYEVAASIARGDGAVFHGRPTAYWPVGYPALLAPLFAISGPSVIAAQLLNLALALGTLLLAHRATLLVGGSVRAARAAVVLLALWPNQIAYTSLVANETLSSFLVLLGVVLLLARRWWQDLLAGLVFGYACLVKPQVALLPIAVLLVMQRSRWRPFGAALRRMVLRSGLVYALLVLVLVPWTVRNWRLFGGLVFVANSGGVNLFIGNHPGATGTYPRPDEGARLSGALLPFDIGSTEYQADQKARALAVDYLVHHPGAALATLPRKLFHLYAKDVEGFSWMQEGAPQARGRYLLLPALKVTAQIYYMLVLLAAGAALHVLFRQRRAQVLLVPACVVGYFTCIYLVYFAIGRFHFVMVPWLAACAALAVSRDHPGPAT